MLLAVQAVVIRVRTELPAFIPHHRLDHIHRDDVFEAFQLAEDDGSVRPGAGERDIEVIAARLRCEPAATRRPGTAVAGHPVAEGRGRPDEAPRARVDQVVLPDTADEDTHGHTALFCSPHRA